MDLSKSEASQDYIGRPHLKMKEEKGKEETEGGEKKVKKVLS